MSESDDEQLSPVISRMDLSSSEEGDLEHQQQRQRQRQRRSARQRFEAEADKDEYVEVGEVKGSEDNEDNNKGGNSEVLPNIKTLSIAEIALKAQFLHPFTEESTDAQSNYSGYLKQINDDKMPKPGTNEHEHLFVALMVEYFYQYFRETNVFTQEQNNLVDSKELLADKIMVKYMQVCGHDIGKE